MRPNTNTHIRFGCLNSNKQSPHGVKQFVILRTMYYMYMMNKSISAPRPRVDPLPVRAVRIGYCHVNATRYPDNVRCHVELVTPFILLFDISNKILYSQQHLSRCEDDGWGHQSPPRTSGIFRCARIAIPCQSSLLSGAHTQTHGLICNGAMLSFRFRWNMTLMEIYTCVLCQRRVCFSFMALEKWYLHIALFTAGSFKLTCTAYSPDMRYCGMFYVLRFEILGIKVSFYRY